jgi:hypothetical protein
MLFTVTLNFQFHASSDLYRVKEILVPDGSVAGWAVGCQVTELHVTNFSVIYFSRAKEQCSVLIDKMDTNTHKNIKVTIFPNVED